MLFKQQKLLFKQHNQAGPAVRVFLMFGVLNAKNLAFNTPDTST